MKDQRSKARVWHVAIAALFVVAMLAMAGCACSSTASSSASSASSASSSSSASASSSSSSASSSSTVTVPNVVSLAEKEASKAIADAGLKVGVVKHEASDTVEKGKVVSQEPKAQASAKAGDAVDIVVSDGKAQPKEVKVPDLKGLAQADAEKALADVKLVGVASNPEESEEVAPGQVFKQSIPAGSTAREGDKVAFTVALSPAQVDVPNVVGKTHDEAKKAITDAKLGFDYTTAYDDNVAEDHVISQSVAAGTKVKSGSTVSVAISLGAKPVSDVAVPNLMTYSWQEAQDALDSAGLKANYTGDEDGIVVAQDVAAGTMVAPGTTVTVELHKDEPQNPIMNFVGSYSSDRPTIDVEASGDADGAFTVHWSSGAEEYTTWTMSGTFDEKTKTVKYTNGKKVNTTTGDDGKTTDETVYTDGAGTITFSDKDGLSLTWTDNEEHVADDMTFTFDS